MTNFCESNFRVDKKEKSKLRYFGGLGTNFNFQKVRFDP